MTREETDAIPRRKRYKTKEETGADPRRNGTKPGRKLIPIPNEQKDQAAKARQLQ